MNFIKSTHIAVLFVIEEKKGVSTKGGPQFLRCLHTKEKQLKKSDESRHVDRYFKNKIVHFLLSISFIHFLPSKEESKVTQQRKKQQHQQKPGWWHFWERPDESTDSFTAKETEKPQQIQVYDINNSVYMLVWIPLDLRGIMTLHHWNN